MAEMSYEMYNARCAFNRFQSAFFALKQDMQFVIPVEILKDFQQLDAACRQFFDAANDKMFSKAASPPRDRLQKIAESLNAAARKP